MKDNMKVIDIDSHSPPRSSGTSPVREVQRGGDVQNVKRTKTIAQYFSKSSGSEHGANSGVVRDERLERAERRAQTAELRANQAETLAAAAEKRAALLNDQVSFRRICKLNVIGLSLSFMS